MKKHLLVFYLIVYSLNAFSQKSDRTKLSTDLQLKLNEIDQYVKKTDSNLNLVKRTITYDYVNGGVREGIDFFTDSTFKYIVKNASQEIRSGKTYWSIGYYKNGTIIYIKEMSDPIEKGVMGNEFYYENKKVIYSPNR